jgi:hypothetical protein
VTNKAVFGGSGSYPLEGGTSTLPCRVSDIRLQAWLHWLRCSSVQPGRSKSGKLCRSRRCRHTDHYD